MSERSPEPSRRAQTSAVRRVRGHVCSLEPELLLPPERVTLLPLDPRLALNPNRLVVKV